MTRHEHRVSTYGVSLLTDIDLDLPNHDPLQDTLPDVTLLEGEPSDFPATPGSSARTDWFTCRRNDDGSYYLRWSDFYDFKIDGSGARVVYRALAGSHPDILRNFLFGQVLSFSLVLQGREPLHATAVCVGGRAVAFLGDCRYGKSTLGATFVRDGYPFLTDDLLLLERRGSVLYVAPGPGRIKLNPDSADLLGRSARSGMLNPMTNKRAYDLEPGRLTGAPVPLAAVFALPSPDERESARAVKVDRLSAPQLFRVLLENSFNPYVEDSRRLERHFAFVAAIAAGSRGFALSYPNGLGHLPEIRHAVLGAVEAINGGLMAKALSNNAH